MKSLKVLFMVAFIALFLVLVALSPPATQTSEQNSVKIAIIADIVIDPADTGPPGHGNAYAVALTLNEYETNAQAQAMSHEFINDNNGTAIAMEFKKAGGTDITVLQKYLLTTSTRLIVA